MKLVSLTAGALLAASLSVPASAEPMAMDTPINMGTLTVACSGVGSAKDDPQWQAYPSRIEFSNGAAQYLAGVHVTIAHGGATQADFECGGPWVLVKGPKGTYKVTASLLWEDDKAPRSTSFVLGQKRVVMQFGKTVPRSNSALTAPVQSMPTAGSGSQ